MRNLLPRCGKLMHNLVQIDGGVHQKREALKAASAAGLLRFCAAPLCRESSWGAVASGGSGQTLRKSPREAARTAICPKGKRDRFALSVRVLRCLFRFFPLAQRPLVIKGHQSVG